MRANTEPLGDRTDPFLPASGGEEYALSENYAKLVRVFRSGASHIRWEWKGEPPGHVKKLLHALPNILPGCEDLLLESAGYTASDFDFTLEDSAQGLSLADALPLLAQAIGLDAAFSEAAEVSLAGFDPSRIYLSNANASRVKGLNDYRLRFYHLEDLSPEAKPFSISGGIAGWLNGEFSGRKGSPAFAGNQQALCGFLADIAKNPSGFAGTMTSLRLSISHAAATHVGIVRSNNEDAYMANTCVIEGSTDSSSLFAVADGMGGHNAGELASALCLDLLRFYSGLWPLSRGAGRRNTPSLMGEHLCAISRELRKYSAFAPEFAGMGTTLAGVYMAHPGSLDGGFPAVALSGYVFNVGDSRAFAVSQNGVRPLTRDHSLVQEMLETGSITEDQSFTHPQRNVISQGMGITPEVKPDVFPLRLPLDAFTVICSDGLTDLVRPARLAALAGEASTPAALADALIQEALSLGGKDNITAIVLMPRLSFAE